MDFDASKQAMINVLNHEIKLLNKKIKALETELRRMEDSRCDACATPRYIVNDDEQQRLF